MNISYKGFTARVDFSADNDCFVGWIVGIDDIVTFHADTVENLKTEMKSMVEFYLETCRKLKDH